jgi:hypothetical protein
VLEFAVRASLPRNSTTAPGSRPQSLCASHHGRTSPHKVPRCDTEAGCMVVAPATPAAARGAEACPWKGRDIDAIAVDQLLGRSTSFHRLPSAHRWGCHHVRSSIVQPSLYTFNLCLDASRLQPWISTFSTFSSLYRGRCAWSRRHAYALALCTDQIKLQAFAHRSQPYEQLRRPCPSRRVWSDSSCSYSWWGPLHACPKSLLPSPHYLFPRAACAVSRASKRCKACMFMCMDASKAYCICICYLFTS